MPSISRVLHQGLAADKPAADATLNQGWLYYETDTDTLRQSWNGTWIPIKVAAGYGKIDEVVVGAGGQATIEFHTIPDTFRSLRLIGTGRGSVVGAYTAVGMQFNGDGGGNYDMEGFYSYGVGNGVTSIGELGATSIDVWNIPGTTAPANSADMFEVVIPGYAGSVFHKNALSVFSAKRSASDTDHLEASTVGWWSSTAPITDIVLAPASGSFIEGTIVTLYGLA